MIQNLLLEYVPSDNLLIKMKQEDIVISMKDTLATTAATAEKTTTDEDNLVQSAMWISLEDQDDTAPTSNHFATYRGSGLSRTIVALSDSSNKMRVTVKEKGSKQAHETHKAHQQGLLNDFDYVGYVSLMKALQGVKKFDVKENRQKLCTVSILSLLSFPMLNIYVGNSSVYGH